MLDPRQIVLTAERLRDRIGERFPGSGLWRMSDDLVRVAGLTVERLRWVTQPQRAVRLGVGVLIALILIVVAAILVLGVRGADSPGAIDLPNLIQAFESVLNEVFLIGAAIFFLVTVEGRIKRRRALGFMRELRALAHIVDMHQLTKDPDRFLTTGTDTPSSPTRGMTRFQMGRYLDYCSEMLSLISKIAALYAQDLDDPVVLEAVDQVETMTTGLSSKIWQKIMILEGPPPSGR